MADSTEYAYMGFRVYKYPLQIVDDQTLTLQGKPLSVILQNDTIMLYALYSERIKPQTYDIHISGTGHLIDDKIIREYTFLDTVLLYHGNLVFHIFYKNRDKRAE